MKTKLPTNNGALGAMGSLAKNRIPRVHRVRSWTLGVGLVLALALGLESGAADTEPLRVGVTPIFPPMIHQEGGKIVGIEADFAAALGQELGRSVKFVEVKWEDQFSALADNRTDIIMSSVSITRARQTQAAFATPYLTIGQMPLVRREDAYKYGLGFPARPQGVIGVVKATTGDFLVQQNFPSAKRKHFASGERAAKALLKKQIDLFLCDSPTIWWLGGVNEAAGLVAVPIALSEEHLAWAVRKTDAELLTAVNRALESMRQRGEVTTIIRRWIPQFK